MAKQELPSRVIYGEKRAADVGTAIETIPVLTAMVYEMFRVMFPKVPAKDYDLRSTKKVK